MIMQVLNLSCLLISLLDIPAGVQRRHAARGHSFQCHSFDSCHFYTHCIERHLRCGHDGFAISYAQKRCREIKKLRAISFNCPTCVSREAHTWAHKTEQCLQRKLWSLVQRQYHGQNPDPQTCLHWEKAAIADMNTCYSSEFNGLTLSDSDITRLMNRFHIGGMYFTTAVDRGFPKVVKRSNSRLAASLLKTNFRNRHIFCVKANRYVEGAEVELTGEDYIHAVQHVVRLNASQARYWYAGSDADAEVCNDHKPSHVSAPSETSYDFHIVTMFSDAPVHTEEDDSSQFTIHIPDGNYVDGVLFQLTSMPAFKNMRDPSQCGDGKRHAEENCDYGENYEACSLNCTVREGYDCTTERLKPSRCWKEECGNGIRTTGEECDDGNNRTNDGCDKSCRLEENYSCTTTYNRTSTCLVLPRAQIQQRAPARLVASSNDINLVGNERTLHSGSKPLALSSISTAWLVGLVLLCLR